MSEIVSEFSRIVSVARLSPQGSEEYLEAKPLERAALAKRFDILDITSLKAWLAVEPTSVPIIGVHGKIQATLVQTCVVTLERLVRPMELDIDLVFKPLETHVDDEGEPILGALDNDIEFFTGGKIDLGELVAQHVGVNIDLYPRKANATLPTSDSAVKEVKANPFAQLAALTAKIDPVSK